MRQKKVIIVIVAILAFGIISCKLFSDKETAYVFSNGNKIVYDVGLFGDATVLYENTDEENCTLLYYRHADDNERIYNDGIKDSSDGTVVAVLISESTNTKNYPKETGLYMFKMDLSSGVAISDSETITDVIVSSISSVTNDSVTYILSDGSSVTKEFN